MKVEKWVLVVGYKVGKIITEWLGQAQFSPQVMGYVEEVPPVPSENLTGGVVISANNASKVDIIESDSPLGLVGGTKVGVFEGAVLGGRGGSREGRVGDGVLRGRCLVCGSWGEVLVAAAEGRLIPGAGVGVVLGVRVRRTALLLRRLLLARVVRRGRATGRALVARGGGRRVGA